MFKNNIDEIIEAQKKPFEYVVFSGGGAKGAIYSGVAEELSRSGVIHGIKSIAGSSAGAITAAFISSGITPEKFKKLSTETNLKGLQGGGVVVHDGKPLYKLLQETISSNISEYLDGHKDLLSLCHKSMDGINEELYSTKDKVQSKLLNEKKQQLQKIIDNDAKELKELRNNAQQGNKILFKDLALMNLIEPSKFKELVITATNKETGELTIFDTRNTPNVEIAIACKASASIPIVFEPVEINGVKYVDGGYRDNIPQKYFSEEDKAKDITNSKTEIAESKKQGRTLALAFGGEGSEAQMAIYTAKKKIIDPGSIMKFLVDVVFKSIARVGGKFSYSEEENKTYDTLRENALNVITLDTKNVGTLSFDEAQRNAEYLHIKGQMQTARHFANHEIGENIDKNLTKKEFILSIFEESEKTGVISSLKEKFLQGKDEKQNKILNFVKNETWEGRDKNDILCDFVKVAATDRSTKKLSINTTTMSKVITVLNSTTTSNEIKKDFIELLKIDCKNIANLKFKSSDFDDLIKTLAKETQNKDNKKDTIKEIIAKGKKENQIDTVKESREQNIDKHR